jgi:glycosyltransferase involved in cell wall biosynthesis
MMLENSKNFRHHGNLHGSPVISIIIPVHNRLKPLKKCLESVFSQNYKNFEVIVVDDASTVDLKAIKNSYPVRYYRLAKNRGPGFARNFGVKHSRGEIVLFIDSDVLANKGLLKKIYTHFKINKDIVAVQGNYSLIPYFRNFFSFFKNITLYYHFKTFSKKYTNSIASFCTAVKRKEFLDSGGFDEKIRNASIEDEEFGIKLTQEGHKILYDNELQVQHMKKFNLYSLVRQDYRTGFDRIKSLLRTKNLFDKAGIKGSHSNFSLLASIPLSGLIILDLVLLLLFQSAILMNIMAVLLLTFILINFRYFKFVLKTKNAGFLVLTFFFSILDNFAIQIGITFGLFDYIFKRKY